MTGLIDAEGCYKIIGFKTLYFENFYEVVELKKSSPSIIRVGENTEN